ncbi:MAG: RluA family pseudouridine synthase [Alphaproteobacteria bacterium]|nr:RluA family pseudouridine synthase [Alphaproteobacteria bacterium]
MADVEERPCRDGADRLDRWLAAWPRVGSRRKASALLAGGKVDVDGRTVGPVEGGLPVPAGSRVAVVWDRPGTSRQAVRARGELVEAGLRILHEDDRVVAIDKPPGLLTDTATARQARERDSVRARITAWLRPRGQRPVVVHRIDADTSGVVLLAKDAEAGERLREAFAAHRPERTYLAWVHGVPHAAEGTWEDTVWWDPRANVQRAVAPDAPGAAQARSHWRVDGRGGGLARLEVRLDTGRRNQIRLQAALRGHPLVGERQYLPDAWTPRPPSFPRQALHAHRLVFPHPDDGRPVAVDAPLPADLARLDARLQPPLGGRR